MSIKIHPSVGVSRLGNSETEICVAPDSIGGLPYNADYYGNTQGEITSFKDDSHRIKRQGQVFHLLDDDGTEITLDTSNVESIVWTVHLANKKAAWYQYNELQGNLLYGDGNSYQNLKVDLRNPDVVGDKRQTLIVDPGPRTISGREQQIGFDKDNVPTGYTAQYPPETVAHGVPVTTLGELRTDSQGRLVVLGGFGHSGGNAELTNYGGSNTWNDDISDGPVYCTVTFTDQTPALELTAWALVGSPDFAPEIVNISTLSDTMFDVAVRNFNLVPEMCKDGNWNPNYQASFHRDILPIIERIRRYQWVANVQSMSAFFSNIFDFADPTTPNKDNRLNYFSYFRAPDGVPPVSSNPNEQPQQQLFKGDKTYDFPMMPLNSGSNSVSNETIVKFLALNETQYFLLGQWAKGEFDNNPVYEEYPVNPADMASVGNCVGLPMCPGIEVTWSLQNPNIYDSAYRIAQYKNEDWYLKNGLTPSRDECEGGGCEPGDLTKRMACPWQADFFQCTIQYVNFTDPTVNKEPEGNGNREKAPLVPKPPTYYSYWWPPQSPWDVLTGETSVEGQAIGHLPAGQQMNYARGINNFVQMVEHWYALGFIRNQNTANGQGDDFPYLVETERTNELFSYKEVPVSQISGNPDDDETTIPVFYLEYNKPKIRGRSDRSRKLVEYLEKRAFKAIKIAPGGLGHPRSGTRARR